MVERVNAQRVERARSVEPDSGDVELVTRRRELEALFSNGKSGVETGSKQLVARAGELFVVSAFAGSEKDIVEVGDAPVDVGIAVEPIEADSTVDGVGSTTSMRRGLILVRPAPRRLQVHRTANLHRQHPE